MQCVLYQRAIGSIDQRAKPVYETWCRTHGCHRDSKPCIHQRIANLEEQVRWWLLHYEKSADGYSIAVPLYQIEALLAPAVSEKNTQ